MRNKPTTWIVILLVFHAILLAISATLHSPTLNEPRQLVSGISNWKFGRFELGCENPPLVRLFAALPVLVLDHSEDWTGFVQTPGSRPGFNMGLRFVKANGTEAIHLFTVARLVCIPFSLVGALVCFYWSRDLWGSNSAGLLSMALWVFDPNILAHGELITGDCAAASLGLAANYAFWRWLKHPAWAYAMAAGLLLGLAELTKMTWIILFAIWPFLYLFWDGIGYLKLFHIGRVRSVQIAQFASILFIGLYVLNLGYGFQGCGTPLNKLVFVSKQFTGHEQTGTPGNRFSHSLVGRIPIPVPKAYLIGMDLQTVDQEHYEQMSYLRGEWKVGGWWYYYIYGLAVKSPHGTQILLLMAISAIIFLKKYDDVGKRDFIVLFAAPVVLFTLVSSHLAFNQHLRYVLPVLGFLFVFIGCSVRWLEAVSNTARHR